MHEPDQFTEIEDIHPVFDMENFLSHKKSCPLCHQPADHAIWGLFPIWLCTKCEPEACVPFGFWASICIWFVTIIPVPCFAFFVCPDEPFWYIRGLRVMLFSREPDEE